MNDIVIIEDFEVEHNPVERLLEILVEIQEVEGDISALKLEKSSINRMLNGEEDRGDVTILELYERRGEINWEITRKKSILEELQLDKTIEELTIEIAYMEFLESLRYNRGRA